MDVQPSAAMSIPQGVPHSLFRLGQWTSLYMEHTRIEPVRMAGAAPLHHLTLPLGRPPRMEMSFGGFGRRYRPAFDPDEVLAIEAGADGSVWWDDPHESACFFFSPEALSAAAGLGDRAAGLPLSTPGGFRNPVAVHLLRALLAEAEAGQPGGRLAGDAIFAALAMQLVPEGRAGSGPVVADWRVRRALEHIHAHLTGPLDLTSIAAAAGTSPYHLSRCFRAATGRSIWRYVLGERARRAATLMRDPNLSLTQAAEASGFESYSSFVAAIRREFGLTPRSLRASLRC